MWNVESYFKNPRAYTLERSYSFRAQPKMEVTLEEESFTWPPIISKRSCEWCTSPLWIREQFADLCKLPWRLWYSDLLLDLQHCGDCTLEYHQIQEDFVEKNPSKKKELWLGDVERLSLWFKQALDLPSFKYCSALEALDNLENDFPAIPSNTKYNIHSLEIHIQEVLHYPQLLFDKRLYQLFECAVATLIDQGNPPLFVTRLPGIYIILLNNSHKLRKWAEKTLKRLPNITQSDFDTLSPTIQSIIEVATLNLFENGSLLEDPPDITMATYLPGHLFGAPSVYWKGFLRLLYSMEREVIVERVMGVEGHRDLADTILNVIDGEQGQERDVFWRAFHCFIIILKYCSSRIWPVLTRTPQEVFDIITNHHIFIRDVKKYLEKSNGSSGDETILFSNSQESSQEYRLDSQSLSSDGLPKTALAWFQTFAESLLDFGDVSTQCIPVIISTLDHFSGYLDVKIKIALIASRVMRSRQLSSLVSTAHLWLPHVLELSAKLDETNKKILYSVIKPAREMVEQLILRTTNHTRSPPENIDFSKLTDEKIKDLTQAIISQLKSTEAGKIPCANTTNPPDSPPTPSKKSTQQLQPQATQQVHCRGKCEQKSQNERQANSAAADTKYSQIVSNIGKLKCSLNGSEKPKTPDVANWLPVIKLEDCCKSGSKYKEKSPGYKDKPICLDDSDDNDFNHNSTKQTPPTASFATFQARSIERSYEKLQKMRTKIVSPQTSTPDSNKSKTRKRSLNFSKARKNSDETSSLESNSDDDFELQLKRSPKKKKSQIIESVDDDTDSLEDDVPLAELCKNRITPRKKIACETKHGHCYRSPCSKTPTSNSGNGDPLSSPPRSSTSQGLVSTSSRFPKTSTQYFTPQTKSNMTESSKSQRTDSERSNTKTHTSTCDLNSKRSRDIAFTEDKNIFAIALKASSGMTVSDFKAMAITNINVDETLNCSNKSAYPNARSLGVNKHHDLKQKPPRADHVIDSHVTPTTNEEQKDVNEDHNLKHNASRADHVVNSHMTTNKSYSKEEDNKPIPRNHDLKHNASRAAHVVNSDVTPTTNSFYSSEEHKDVKPLPEELERQRIYYDERQRQRLTATVEQITNMFENSGYDLVSDDSECEEDLNDISRKGDFKAPGKNIQMGVYADLENDSGTESSGSDTLHRLDQLIEQNEHKYGSKGNFLENLVRDRSKDEGSRDEILAAYKENIDTSNNDLHGFDALKLSKLPSTKVKSEIIGTKTEEKNNNRDGKVAEIAGNLLDPDDDHLFDEINLEDLHCGSSTKTLCSRRNERSSSSDTASLDSLLWEDLEKALEDSRRQGGPQNSFKPVDEVEQEMCISEMEDDVFLRDMDLDGLEAQNVTTVVKVEKDDEKIASDDELILFSSSELLDEDGVLPVDVEPPKESMNQTDQGLVSMKPEWRDHFNANQTESAFASVVADISSPDDESDDDLVEILCSQSFKPSVVKVKVEKPDENQLNGASQYESVVAKSAKFAETRPSPDQTCVTPNILGSFSTTARPPSVPLKPADASCSIKLTEEHLVKQVLSWRTEWLSVHSSNAIIHKLLEGAEKLPKTFDCMDEFCTKFGSLLVLEAWEQAAKEWRDPRCRRGKRICKVQSVTDNRSYKMIRGLVSDITSKEYNERVLPDEKDLVQISVEGCNIFGLVQRVESEKIYRRVSSSSDHNDSFNEASYNVSFTIQTYTPVSPRDGVMIDMQVVTSLQTTFRQWSALISFSQQNFLAKDILRPRSVKYFCSDEKPNDVIGNEKYNQSQVSVIETVSQAVKQPLVIPRICLVQGPPGTGKSHTIVGMVTKLLNQEESQSIQSQPSQLLPDKPRILICCPSNEAIDELVRKLMRAKPRKTTSSNNSNKGKGGARIVNCGDFSLIRVGRMSKINDSVKGATLDHLVKHAVQKAGYSRDGTSVTQIKKDLKKIDREISKLEKEKFTLRREGLETDEHTKEHLQKLKQELLNLMDKQRTIKKKLFTEKERQSFCLRMESGIRKEILNNADIICSTLSSSGNPSLMNELRGTNGKKIPFSCVIVDEACQCTELDTLIPLQYKSSKLILVGDPEQLPATVISKEAKNLLYGRSMFERLYKYFKELRRNERPVHLLNVQYRMHREISKWPNSFIYNHGIIDDISVLNRAFPIKKHYALFNVHGGRETNDRKGTIRNRKEAQLVLSLCHYLLHHGIKPTDVGIITPYRAQLIELREQLRVSETYRGIEVNTVDGFQGREKNVIVMSCVRSGSNIGFLECPRRLNVALTRARHALYVFGNLDSLVKSEGWKNLVDDARNRGLIYHVDNSNDVKRAINLATASSKHHSSSSSHKRPDEVAQKPTNRSSAASETKTKSEQLTNNQDKVNKCPYSRSLPASTKQDSRQGNTKDTGNSSPSSSASQKMDESRTTSSSTSSLPLCSDHVSLPSLKPLKLTKSLPPLNKPTEITSNTLKRRHSTESGKSPKKVHFYKAYVTLFTEHRATQSFCYPIENDPVDTGTSYPDVNHSDDIHHDGVTSYKNNPNCAGKTGEARLKGPESTSRCESSKSTYSLPPQETRRSSGSIDHRNANTPTGCGEQHVKRIVTTQEAQPPVKPIHSTSTAHTSVSTAISHIITPQEAQTYSCQVTETQTSTTNNFARRLEEATSRVRENNRAARTPVIVSPTNYRVGRGGRLVNKNVQNSTPIDQLRDWQPHGGPRERIAPNGPNLVRFTRSRAIQNGVVENPSTVRRTRKRVSLREEVEKFNKRKRKKQ